MSVQELKTAIARLPTSDLTDLARWFEEFQQNTKDHDTDRDDKITGQKVRTAGLHTGTARIREDFDEPLPEES